MAFAVLERMNSTFSCLYLLLMFLYTLLIFVSASSNELAVMKISICITNQRKVTKNKRNKRSKRDERNERYKKK